jgi:hypothetical protein
MNKRNSTHGICFLSLFLRCSACMLLSTLGLQTLTQDFFFSQTTPNTYACFSVTGAGRDYNNRSIDRSALTTRLGMQNTHTRTRNSRAGGRAHPPVHQNPVLPCFLALGFGAAQGPGLHGITPAPPVLASSTSPPRPTATSASARERSDHQLIMQARQRPAAG